MRPIHLSVLLMQYIGLLKADANETWAANSLRHLRSQGLLDEFYCTTEKGARLVSRVCEEAAIADSKTRLTDGMQAEVKIPKDHPAVKALERYREMKRQQNKLVGRKFKARNGATVDVRAVRGGDFPLVCSVSVKREYTTMVVSSNYNYQGEPEFLKEEFSFELDTSELYQVFTDKSGRVGICKVSEKSSAGAADWWDITLKIDEHERRIEKAE